MPPNVGCCPMGRIPSDDYGIPTCNSNDVSRSAVGLSQATNRWKQMRTHAPKRRECLLFRITWAQISSRDASFKFSLHAGAVLWPLLPEETRFVDVLTWVFMMRWPRQNRPLAKKDWRALIRACQNTSWYLCTYQQTILWIHGTVSAWVPRCNGQYHWMCFKC